MISEDSAEQDSLDESSAFLIEGAKWMMVRYAGAEVKDIGLRGGGGSTAMPLFRKSMQCTVSFF